MALLALILILLNVLLGIAVALVAQKYGTDRLVLTLQGLGEPRQADAAEARRRRIKADEQAWRFDQ